MHRHDEREHTDPLVPYRLRTVAIGVEATALIVAALALLPFLPGHGPIDPVPYAVVVGFGGVGGLVVGCLIPWARLLEGRFGMPMLYAWSIVDIILICVGVAASGGARSDLFLIFGLTTLFFAASYPPRGQAALLALTNGAYLVTLAVSGWGIGGGALFVRLATVNIIAFLGSFLARELSREMLEHRSARRESEDRAEQLAHAANEARRREASFRLLFSGNPHPMWVHDRLTLQILEVNAAAERHYAFSRDEFLQLSLSDIVLATDPTAAADEGELVNRLEKHRCGDGRVVEAEVTSHPLEFGGRDATFVMAADVTARRRAEADRANTEKRLAAIMQNSSDIIWVLGRDGRIRYSTPAVERLLGPVDGYEVGADALRLVHPDDIERVRVAFARVVASPGVGEPLELRLQRSDGTWRVFEAIGNNLLSEPAVAGIVVNARDVTERREMEAELAHQALHDHLTGLPNRALLRDRLDHALTTAARRGTCVAIVFVDLDHFKLVNDTMGHAAGDALLVAVSNRLVDVVRAGDTIARLGGDEFVLLCEDVNGEDDAHLVAARVHEAMSEPFTVDGQEIFANASIGITVAARGVLDVDADALLGQADAAMYAAKRRGRARVEVFDERLRNAALERLETETSLRRALERGEFELWFQPKVTLSSGEIMGAEALIRWRHPTRGLVLPGDFIGVAEECGLIVPIGEWVINTACAEAVKWEAHSGRVAPVISVNISGRQLAEPDLVEIVRRALETTGLAPSRLLLEITETTLMDDAGGSVDLLNALKQIGVRIAIDDFGTGYSSLSYLRQFPIDFLKVDRSFVANLDLDHESVAIVRAVIAMAHSLGLTAVAEGVEEPNQAEQLLALGCDLAQGFWFGRPTPAADLEELIASPHRLPRPPASNAGRRFAPGGIETANVRVPARRH